MFRIDAIRHITNASSQKLCASFDGNELFYQTPADVPLALSAEPFLMALLIPAMQRGIDIHVDEQYTISPKLLEGLSRLQTILPFWYEGLRPITIKARPGVVPANPAFASGTALLFSGGLDASHSLMQHADRVTHLIYVRGIDLQLDDEPLWQRCLATNRELATHFGKTLVPLESNVRFFIRQMTQPALGWYTAQGAGLSSITRALGFPLTLISSSNTYGALHPLGSHPLTDPLWSSDACQIQHVGAEKRRHEKLQAVASDPYLLDRVRVCWHAGALNCGVCDKCLHFRMALSLLNLRTPNFAPMTNYFDLPGAHVGTEGEMKEWEDNLLLARKTGNVQAEKAVLKLLNGYKRKQGLKLLDEAFFSGAFRSLFKKIK